MTKQKAAKTSVTVPSLLLPRPHRRNKRWGASFSSFGSLGFLVFLFFAALVVGKSGFFVLLLFLLELAAYAVA